MKTKVKVEAGRKARKVSVARVWKALKKYLNEEQFIAFVQSLPTKDYSEAFLSRNPEQFWGQYLLGERAEEYMSASAPMRKIITAQVIAQHLMRARIPVPVDIQKQANKKPGSRGPRSGSKRQKYEYILSQTRELMKDPNLESIYPYLREVETAMENEIQRLEAIKQSMKNSREKKNQK